MLLLGQIPIGIYSGIWDGSTMEMIIRMEHGYGSRALAGPMRTPLALLMG